MPHSVTLCPIIFRDLVVRRERIAPNGLRAEVLPVGTRVPAVLRPGDELCLLVVHSLPTVECGCRISGKLSNTATDAEAVSGPPPYMQAEFKSRRGHSAVCLRDLAFLTVFRCSGVLSAALMCWLFSWCDGALRHFERQVHYTVTWIRKKGRDIESSPCRALRRRAENL